MRTRGHDTLQKLYIEPSSKCNLNCAMCFRNGWIGEQQGFMEDAVFDRILASLRAMPPVRVLFGGMGEPLLHPRLPQWIAGLHEASCRTELITNGTLLDPALSLELLRCGLDRVWVSMEGFSREACGRDRRGSTLNGLTANLEGYNRARERCGRGELGIAFVMLPENMTELNRINAFADRYGADALNISHAIPAGPVSREEALFRDRYPVGEMARWRSDFSPPKADYCRFVSEGNCFVRWDGDVAPCMQLLHECSTYLFEEKRCIHRRSFGSIRHSSLREIWEFEEYSLFRARVKAFDFPSCIHCDGCDDRLSNMTDCAFNPFPTCGACLWAQGIIFCP